MTEISGELKSIIFENSQNMYKILLVDLRTSLPGYSESEIKVTGTFGDLEIGQEYSFTGDLVTHPKYGQQFQAVSCQPALPQETGGVVKYLSSDKFPGIGTKTAEKIVDQLGADALKSLQADPAQIEQLDLTPKQKNSLQTGLSQLDSFDELALSLANYGIPRKVAGRLYQKYHDQTLKKLQADPYLALGEVSGYSFKEADRLARGLGLAQDSLERADGGILAVLLQALTMDGETYLELDQLLPAAKEMTGIDYDQLAAGVNDLQDKRKVVVENGRASLLAPFQVESEIVTDLEDLLAKGKEEDYKDKDLDQAIRQAEKKLGISYDPEQKQAIKNAVTSPVSILTGGPGSGKTTIIDGILLALKDLAGMDEEEAEEEILLAAPTGRAAKRMGEVTGYPAKTIHRLLGLGIDNSAEMELNDLEGEILIVDEMSMVDIYLFEKLLSAISNVRHLVFVGDKDQLPSVGAGKVFADLIEADFIPTCQLKVVHRQKDDSTIIPLAHAVNEGADPAVLLKKTASYSFIPCPPQAVDSAVEQITQAALKSGFAADDIQVLGAMYRGDGGINSLNDTLQRVINPEKGNDKAVEAHGENFRLHDRVLQLQNDPERGIYNGEIGKVAAVEPEMTADEEDETKLLVNFDGKEVAYSQADLNNLTRAYAITIHKSQGSEFPLVILCLTMQNYIMLKRNLLYTAITRASQKLVMVGEERAFAQAMRVKGNERRTNLVWLLKDRFKPEAAENAAAEDQEAEAKSEPKEQKADYILTGARISRAEISPMVGMEDLVQGCKNLAEIVRKRPQGQ
ncbi:ATP-dependent RecD-like DNA helicase [Lactobacillus nasalidis]|uniref:ATP-dependent RecD2 DNA helicase n=1 Tax=Lactobacillus nasalidis TaxID=2797258 RepID=A0ABQ3W3M3_9LACO|nr:ATP-dependent RecD-like DNA helicase [Lactobacillus nasalidis]GHV98217.1 ATP-dependent RecD-like DNA helicase [Lactobacillus nasalidis]GHV99887.1 ATP-dependent RecD-like DNA helicase [Lactobacillus nasalidis]GHW01036.1 ATP-dependent RecD-like DNA helicase [Lactobacillus nasalidis]